MRLVDIGSGFDIGVFKTADVLVERRMGHSISGFGNFKSLYRVLSLILDSWLGTSFYKSSFRCHKLTVMSPRRPRYA